MGGVRVGPDGSLPRSRRLKGAVARRLVFASPARPLSADARVPGRVGSSSLCLQCAGLRPPLPGTTVRLRSTPRARQRETSPTPRAGHRGVSAAQDPPATTLRLRQGAHQLERGVEGRRARRRQRSGSRWLVATSEREGAGRDKDPHGLRSRSPLRTRLGHCSRKARRIA